MSLAAVFSPTPGTPGRLSLGSPRKRGVVEVLRGGDAGALDDPGFVVERVVGDTAAVVEHLHVRVVHERVAVAVAGDEDGVDPLFVGAGRERRDHVVGLDAFDLQHGDVQRLDHLFDERELRHEDVGRLLAVALVVAVEVVAVGAARGVEHDAEVVGLLVGEHLHQHRREAVDRVRDRALGRGEIGGQRVERAERERVAVEQEQLLGHAQKVRA